MPYSIYLGIDLGGTSIKMGIVNEQGSLLNSYETLTPGEHLEVIQTLDQMSQTLLNESGFKWDNVKGVGIGIPGFVDPNSQIVMEAPNINWSNVNIKELLEQKWSVVVEVDNDANVAALGEMWNGAGKGAKNIICITIGTGIGGGIIINGDIYRGARGMAGEIGHYQIRENSSRDCNCGKSGCLETEASATAMVHYGMEEIKNNTSHALQVEYQKSGKITARTIIELAKINDSICKKLLCNVGELIGKTLANICILLNPEKIIIGGGVSNAGELLINPIKNSFKVHALPKIYEHTSIVTAKLGNQAGMIGAAWLVHKNL